MARHKISEEKLSRVRIGLYQLLQQNDCIVIRFSRLSKPWPLVWRRLERAGFAPVIRYAKRRIEISLAGTSLDAVLPILQARKSVSRFRRPLVLVLPISALAMGLLFVPLGQVGVQVKPAVNVESPCSESKLRNSLIGEGEGSDVQIENSIDLGGITTGKLVCRGVQYKYALESKGSERVLKVSKLDS